MALFNVHLFHELNEDDYDSKSEFNYVSSDTEFHQVTTHRYIAI